jgi:hypothetical protein
VISQVFFANSDSASIILFVILVDLIHEKKNEKNNGLTSGFNDRLRHLVNNVAYT